MQFISRQVTRAEARLQAKIAEKPYSKDYLSAFRVDPVQPRGKVYPHSSTRQIARYRRRVSGWKMTNL
jgi:hypothetical protein